MQSGWAPNGLIGQSQYFEEYATCVAFQAGTNLFPTVPLLTGEDVRPGVVATAGDFNQAAAALNRLVERDIPHARTRYGNAVVRVERSHKGNADDQKIFGARFFSHTLQVVHQPNVDRQGAALRVKIQYGKSGVVVEQGADFLYHKSGHMIWETALKIILTRTMVFEALHDLRERNAAVEEFLCIGEKEGRWSAEHFSLLISLFAACSGQMMPETKLMAFSMAPKSRESSGVNPAAIALMGALLSCIAKHHIASFAPQKVSFPLTPTPS